MTPPADDLPEACAAAVLDGGEALWSHRRVCAECARRGAALEGQEPLFEIDPPHPLQHPQRY